MKIETLQTVNKSLLINYLTEVQNDFNPPLFLRISEKSDAKNVNEYCEKLLLKANVYAILDMGKIVAVIAIYTNNTIEHEAYIPILSVKKKYQGRGFATRLLERAIQCAKEFNMKIINVKTWQGNKKAIFLYNKNGFKITQQDELNLYLKKEI